MTSQPLLIDHSRFRRVASALCLIVSGPIIVAGILFAPYPVDSAAMVQDPFRAQLSADLLFLGYLLVVPGIFAILRLIGPRGAGLAHVGAVLALIGWISFPGLVLSDYFQLNVAEHLGPAQADTLMSQFGDYPGLLIVIAPAKYVAGLGLVLLIAAAWRAKAAGWWQVATVALWFVIMVALHGRPAEPVDLVASALLSVGLVSVGFAALQFRRWDSGTGFDAPGQTWSRSPSSPPR